MIKEDLLYKYFSNSLTQQEQEQFKDLLEKDAEFKGKFEFENNLKQVIIEEEKKVLKTKLHALEKELSNKGSTTFQFYESESNKPKKSSFNWRIAASVLLFIGLGWFSYNNFLGVNNISLFEDNYKEYPNTVYSITRGSTDNSPERDAFVAYETQDYNTAIGIFNKIEEEDRKDYHDFYTAQSYLKLNELDLAAIAFNNVIDKEGMFVAESYWYLALINLKDNDKATAISNLKILISKYDYNREKAIQLLEKLN